MISKLHSKEYNDEAERLIKAHENFKNKFMLDNLQAVGEYVFLIKDKPETMYGGLQLPEMAQKKPTTGKIISVGELVQDKNVKKGRTAVFSKQVGSDIELFDTEITVLNGNQQLLGIY